MTSNNFTTVDTVDNEIESAINAGVALAEPTELEPGKTYAVALPDGGKVQIIDRDLDDYRDRPRRKRGTYTVHNATSFVTYLEKHMLPETEIWANILNSTITGVINAHSDINDQGDAEGPAGWEDHVVRFHLQKTPAWTAWKARDGVMAGQLDLAAHIEDRIIDIVSVDGSPSGADMLEVAQTFHATSKVAYSSSQRLSTGEVQLTYSEEGDAKAGRKGQLAIPEKFIVALQPYEGSPIYRVPARFRYRVRDTELEIGYALERPEDVLRTAFTDFVEQIATETSRKVMHGTP